MTPAETLKKARQAAARHSLEAAMLLSLRALKLTGGMTTQHAFHPTRKWRFDFAWPDAKLALEVDGGTFSGGRHTRGKGFEEDCIKLNEAAKLGWFVLRATGRLVKNASVAADVGIMLQQRHPASQPTPAASQPVRA